MLMMKIIYFLLGFLFFDCTILVGLSGFNLSESNLSRFNLSGFNLQAQAEPNNPQKNTRKHSKLKLPKTPSASDFGSASDSGSTSELCSQKSLEQMITLMMRDLPGYANRVGQRARRLKRQGDTFSYILVAGKEDFQPLPLNPNPTSNLPDALESPDVRQVFFTTLERRYTANKPVEMQQYHWLLLTQTNDGWYKVSMRSQIGSYRSQIARNMSPIRDSSDGVIGEGVNIWLRDCRSNSIKI